MYKPRNTPRRRLGEEIEELVRELTAVTGRLGQAFAARNGLHPTDLAALLAVLHAEGRGQPITAGELTAELRVTSGAGTGVIDRLERAGHVRRRRDEKDRRRVHLHYGEEGQRVARAFFGPLGARTDAVLAGFDEAELITVHRFLTEMTQAVTATVHEHEP